MHRARVAVIVGLALSVAGCSGGSDKSSHPSSQTSRTSTTPSAPTSTTVGDLSNPAVLRRVSWQNGDLRAPYHPVLFLGGDQVGEQVTLDMCGATFPSEVRRRARHQVGVERAQKRLSDISIEAVLYDFPAGAGQAMREIRAAKASCPSDYVNSRVAGVPALRFRFAPAPDSSWPKVDGVDRFAIDATVNDQAGTTKHIDLVYLQRGRLLVAFYSDPQARATALTRSLRAFTRVLAQRMAALPAKVVNNTVEA